MSKDIFTDEGLTLLRDWFAGMALQGMLSNPNIDPTGLGRDDALDILAGGSFEIATAMLKARGS